MTLTLFQKTAIATLIATVMLIFIGGLVRATGSGLGCPDWPRCWGSWWPPSSVDEIATKTDADGRAYYEGRHSYPNAEGVREHRRLYVSEFNKAKMWTEYGNRLVGVLIGLFVFATWVQSFQFLRRRPAIFWASFAAFLLVGFQGWLGGMVVRSGLHAGMITLHMVVAIILMVLLLWVAFHSVENPARPPLDDSTRRRLRGPALALLALTVIQIILGTQVREALHDFTHDFTRAAETSESTLPRSDWLAHVGTLDHVHRAFSLAVLGAAVLLIVQCRRHAPLPAALRQSARIIVALVLLQMSFGIALAYFSLPPAFQILHLGTAALLVCAETVAILATAPAAKPGARSSRAILAPK